MKILDKIPGSMYVWAIILLVLLAAFSSYAVQQFPFMLIFSVAAAIVLDVLVYHSHWKRAVRMPFSSIITGLIVGSVAPQNSNVLLVLLAIVVAIFSKHFVRTKHGNVFNPSALGLLVSLVVFSVGDEWWASPNPIVLGFAIPLAFILVLATFKAHRLTSAFSFIAAAFVINLFLFGASSLSTSGVLVAILSINFYFAFVMLSEPKTSPHKKGEQLAYGVGVAALTSMLSFFQLPYSLLTALLFANLCYALRRRGLSIFSLSRNKTPALTL